jgi:hypothetical protein
MKKNEITIDAWDKKRQKPLRYFDINILSSRMH